MIQLETYQLQQMLDSAAEMGANRALVEAGLKKPQIKKAEAYRRYGRRRIDRWIREHKITPVKDSGSTLLLVSQLETVSKIDALYSTTK